MIAKLFSIAETPSGEKSFVAGSLGMYIHTPVFQHAIKLAEDANYDPSADFPGFNANDAYILKRIALYLKGIANKRMKSVSSLSLIPYNQVMLTPGDTGNMIKLVGNPNNSYVYAGTQGVPVIPTDVTRNILNIMSNLEGSETNSEGRYYVYVDVLANTGNYTGHQGEFRTEGAVEAKDSAGRSVDLILDEATGALTGPFGLFLTSDRLLPKLTVGAGTKGGKSAYINATTVNKELADIYTMLEMDARFQYALRLSNRSDVPQLTGPQIYGLIRSSWTGKNSIIKKYDSENLFRCFAMQIGNGFPIHSIAGAILTMAYSTGLVTDLPNKALLSAIKNKIRSNFAKDIFYVRNAPCLNKINAAKCLDIIDVSMRNVG